MPPVPAWESHTENDDVSSDDAAKESNLPSRGLPGPASFEDWMGHQARAAPLLIVRGLKASGRARPDRAGPTNPARTRP